jgi:kynureninase
VIDAIDERTLCVALSHVLFKSAYIHDVAPIAARARSRGALSIIDGYQAVGAMPVNVKELGIDVYIGGCLKWLCGGPGAAFLWVDPERRASLTPRLTGWMAHRNPFAFAATLDRRDDAWRFLHGTPNISALYAARHGLEMIGAIGLEAIRAKSLRQTSLILELASAHGWPARAPADRSRRGGTVALDVPHGLAVSRSLKRREILCDYRTGAGIRFSPHFYSTDEEIAAAVEAVREILEEGSWEGLEESKSPVM